MDIKEIVQSRFKPKDRQEAHAIFDDYSKHGRLTLTYIESVIAFQSCDDGIIVDKNQFGDTVDQSIRKVIIELTRLDFILLCSL